MYLDKRKCAFLLNSTKILQNKMLCPPKEANKLEACKRNEVSLFYVFILEVEDFMCAQPVISLIEIQ